MNDQSLIQLGYGKWQQRIQATVTGRTSYIAVELAGDKEETNKILATRGLPVPQQELVRSADRAVSAAKRLGYPVVTKPYNGNHGRGISIHLTTEEEVRAGFAAAAEHASSVIVETYLTGDDHRLLVVNGELLAATRRTPGHVVGDGVSSIRKLVDLVNQDVREMGAPSRLPGLEMNHARGSPASQRRLAAPSLPFPRAM